MKNVVIGLVIVLVVVGFLYLIPNKTQAPSNTYSNITDFESCASNGYPIQETSPATCRTPDGRAFVESNPPKADVTILVPQPNTKVTTPLHISGTALNNWYFEAVFPATLKDANGNVVAQGQMQAQTDWMVPGTVPFTGTLSWTSTPTTSTGTLILSKDNPSGLPQNDSSVSIPVTF